MKNDEEFNFCVGYHSDDDVMPIEIYKYFTAINRGTIAQAEYILARARMLNPNRDWKIFRLAEIPR